MNTTIHTTAQQILEVIGTEKMSTQAISKALRDRGCCTSSRTVIQMCHRYLDIVGRDGKMLIWQALLPNAKKNPPLKKLVRVLTCGHHLNFDDLVKRVWAHGYKCSSEKVLRMNLGRFYYKKHIKNAIQATIEASKSCAQKLPDPIKTEVNPDVGQKIAAYSQELLVGLSQEDLSIQKAEAAIAAQEEALSKQREDLQVRRNKNEAERRKLSDIIEVIA